DRRNYQEEKHGCAAVPISSLPLIGIPVSNPVPASSSSSSSSSQLTIFYNGSVCVYDDITPEKVRE
ncbi:hypothetical protein M569_08105, partial [Genlisea aurea]